ncbi:hypothetical protein DYB30_004691 [Aphanomyces astaci]|uniref:N-acetyltransferase domain-containing protein n=4 Tax=Aphanomyces astaci TaxID=112090 RepID=A0A397CCY4_APHAT|nr:hypothetical protein DYB30_004691 [Aphanomyces astaci]RHZ04197.1 hypothetical protein DYB31_013109 [Aphanomyces astaci]
MSGLRWTCQRLEELTAVQTYKILQLRCEVFIVEQNTVVLEVDGRDTAESCVHVMGWNDVGDLMAYARVLGPGTIDSNQTTSVIGRVVTHPEARGCGVGKALMLEAIRASEVNWPGARCQLGAQAYLESFYTKLGFERLADVEPYEHHGIAHVEMCLPPSPSDYSS